LEEQRIPNPQVGSSSLSAPADEFSMAIQDDDDKLKQAEAEAEAEPAEDVAETRLAIGEREQPERDEAAAEAAPTSIGATRYVHAAFIAAGILVAYVSGKMLGLIWNSLAQWGEAVRRVPALLRYAEDERETITLGAGALIGIIAVIQTYRKETIRTWADEIAAELSKVTWPSKDMVTNGTIVVVIASIIASVYVAILDRFWSYLTNLVYGA
jgi:preprotein translocase subunit SecE